MYKVNAEKTFRVSKLEHELKCKNYLIEKIKQKLAGEVMRRYLSITWCIDHLQADQQSILALIDETKPSPASVICEISDFARNHSKAGCERLRQGENIQDKKFSS